MTKRDDHRAIEKYRRRRFVASSVIGVVVILVAIAVGRASGGEAVESWPEAGSPSPIAQDWADEAAARRQAAADQQALDSVLQRTPVLRHGAGNLPLIALTFDDGPSRYTPEILDILDRYEVPATFFVIGGTHELAGALIKDIVARGHVVANHTVNHPELNDLGAREQAAEIDAQSRAIELFSGIQPRLFRAPYNIWNETTLQLLERRGMLMVLWSIETRDWAAPGADVIVSDALTNAHPGGIVLLHDGGGDRTQTIAALPRIIEGLQDRGFELVTVPRLFTEDPPVDDQR